MNPEEEFKLIIDATLSAIEAGLVEEVEQTKTALNNWYARVTNKNDLGVVVDWNAAPEWADWFAVDEDGQGFFYAEQPNLNEFGWGFAGMWLEENVCEANYVFEHWRKALMERPKNGREGESS